MANPDNFIESEFDTGLRFTLTLHNYTDSFNAIYSELGGSAGKFVYTKWKKTKDDDKYEYYYLKSGKITLIATVEKESLCLVNVGCGVNTEVFKNNKQRVLKVSAVCALSAGGYVADDLSFFTALFNETRAYEEHSLWFNNSIYKYDKSEKTDTVLFRVIPATAAKRDEWGIKDFRDYEPSS